MARILLVDDEEYIRRLYTEELSEEGHEVSSLASGHELLRKIDFFQPEAVILDIKLDLPVILCSAYDTYKEDQKSIAANYYVVKSFDLSELKMAIQRALESGTTIMKTA
jgi:DNA-binding response OmpR family regulator